MPLGSLPSLEGRSTYGGRGSPFLLAFESVPPLRNGIEDLCSTVRTRMRRRQPALAQSRISSLACPLHSFCGTLELPLGLFRIYYCPAVEISCLDILADIQYSIIEY
jgi:hypothetical protein